MVNKKLRLHEYSLSGANLLEAKEYKKPSTVIDDNTYVLFIKEGKPVISEAKNLDGEMPMLEFVDLKKKTGERIWDHSRIESPTIEYEIDASRVQITYAHTREELIYPTYIHICGKVINMYEFLGFRPIIREELINRNKTRIKNFKN